MESSPKSLQETCMIVIIKQGLSRVPLPEIVKEEVENLERSIMSVFTGKFFTYDHSRTPDSPWDTVELGISVVWNRGKLELVFINTELSLSSKEESLQIKAGKENKVGEVGSSQFMLPGREVTIFDYMIDLERKQLSLIGSCASIFDDRVLPLKIVLSFYPQHHPALSQSRVVTLEIESMLWEKGEAGFDPSWKKSFLFIEARPRPLQAASYDEESESSCSSESEFEPSVNSDSESSGIINESDSD